MKKLYRNRKDAVIAGICKGIADYFDVDVTLIRVIWVVATIFSGPVGIFAYIVMWLMIPENPDYIDITETDSKEEGIRKNKYAGIVLILLGVLFLLLMIKPLILIPLAFLFKLWPLLFIIIGFLIIARSTRSGKR